MKLPRLISWMGKPLQWCTEYPKMAIGMNNFEKYKHFLGSGHGGRTMYLTGPRASTLGFFKMRHLTGHPPNLGSPAEPPSHHCVSPAFWNSCIASKDGLD